MRILIVGADGRYRTEASLARAARELGHDAQVLDALGWRRKLGGLAGPLLTTMAHRFRPEYVLCTRHAGSAGEYALTRILHRRESAFWYFDGDTPLPPRIIALARRVSRVFSTTGYQADAFAELGLESHFLPQGVDPEVDAPAPGAVPEFACDISFVGSGQFTRRHALLEQLAARFSVQVRGTGWDNAPPGLPVFEGRVEGPRFAEVVRGARISLGIDALEAQRRETRGGTSNRLWKVLGCGGLYLGEYLPGVETFATQGVHACWYRSPEDAVAQAESLLADGVTRQRIAAAGRAHALAHHTYRHRLARLLAGQDYTST